MSIPAIFTTVAACSRPDELGSITRDDLVTRIKNGTSQIQHLRSIADEAEQQNYKKHNLMLWAPHAVFRDKRNTENIESFTGLIKIDFDEKDNPGMVAAKLRDRLSEHPSVVLASVSVRGGGVNGALLVDRVPVDVADHKRIEQQVRAMLEEFTGMKADNMSDPQKCLVISHDPDVYVNDHAEPWQVPVAMTTTTKTKTRGTTKLIARGLEYAAMARPGAGHVPRTKSGMAFGAAGCGDNHPDVQRALKIVCAMSNDPEDAARDFLGAVAAGRNSSDAEDRRPTKDELCRQWAALIAEKHGHELHAPVVPVDRKDPSEIHFKDRASRHSRPATGEELHAIYSGAAGRPVSATEAEGIRWYLATAYLPDRGPGHVLEHAIAFDNCLLDFATGELVTDPEAVALIRIRRPLFMREEIGRLSENAIICCWGQSYNVPVLALLELLARAVDPNPGDRMTELIGGGGEGKTQLAEFYIGAVGRENTLCINLQSLAGDSRPRAIYDMKGKLIVYFGDQGADSRRGVEDTIKECLTAPTLTGRAVYRQSESFANTATWIATDNEIMRAFDHSNGAHVRWLRFVFAKSYRGAAQEIQNIHQLWLADEHATNELVSAAAWMAVDRRRARKNWHYWPDLQTTKARYKILACKETKFLLQSFAPGDADDFVSSEEIREAYNKWWEDADHRPALNMDAFITTARLCFGAGVVEYGRGQYDGQRRRGVFGIRVAPQEIESAFTENEKPCIDGAFSTSGEYGQGNNGQKLPQKSTLLFIEKNEIKKREGDEKDVPPADVDVSVHYYNASSDTQTIYNPNPGLNKEF